VATYPVALDALDGELVMVAVDADRLTVVWDERTGADRVRTLGASETVFMPLLSLVQVFLRTFNTPNQCTGRPSSMSLFQPYQNTMTETVVFWVWFDHGKLLG